MKALINRFYISRAPGYQIYNWCNSPCLVEVGLMGTRYKPQANRPCGLALHLMLPFKCAADSFTRDNLEDAVEGEALLVLRASNF